MSVLPFLLSKWDHLYHFSRFHIYVLIYDISFWLTFSDLLHLLVCCVVQLLSGVRLWEPMDYSPPVFPVLQCLPEFAQTHVHWVGNLCEPQSPLCWVWLVIAPLFRAEVRIECHLPISFSVVPISCPQSFPASGFFPKSWPFTSHHITSHHITSGGQSTGASTSASVLPMNIQDWFTLGWTGWISVQSKGLSSIFSNATVQKHQFFSAQPSL